MTDSIRYRSAFIDNANGIIDVENRTVQIVFSTENPVQMYDHLEILGHDQDEVDLSWANSGRAPFLADHDPTCQIGVIESAWIENRCGKAKVRFSRSDEADEYFQDIVDGIRSCISVGYTVDAETPVSQDTVRVTRWKVLENSLVSIPADTSARVGRAKQSSPDREGTPEAQAEEQRAAAPQPQSSKENIMSEITSVDLAAERARSAEIVAMGNKFNLQAEATEFVASGKSADEFRKLVLEKRETPQTITAAPAVIVKKDRSYSVANAVYAVATRDYTNAGYEREVSQELALRSGKQTNGLFIPSNYNMRAAGDPQLTSTTGAGKELVATSRVGNIDPLYNKLAMVQAGAQVLTGLRDNIEFSKSGTATFAWGVEGAAISASTPASSVFQMSPKMAAGLVSFSDKLLRQSDPSVEALVRNDLERGMAAFLDQAFFHGAGGSAPTGLFAQAGVNSVVMGTNGAALDWASVNQFVSKVYQANLSGSTFVGNPQTAAKLNTTQKASGYPTYIMDGYDKLLGYNYVMTNNVLGTGTKGSGTNLSSLAFGDFSQAIIGQWGYTEIDASNSHGTNFAAGLTAIRVIAYVDFAIRYPGAFTVCTDIVTA